MDQSILAALDSEHQYVFHGGGTVIEDFELRQAYNGGVPDGEPAIWATPILNYAIFNALFNKRTCPKGYTAQVNHLNSGNLTYRATKESLEQLNEDSKGYVYVFKQSDFKKVNTSEWVTHKNIKPLKMFEVSRKDFQPVIEILDSN